MATNQQVLGIVGSAVGGGGDVKDMDIAI